MRKVLNRFFTMFIRALPRIFNHVGINVGMELRLKSQAVDMPLNLCSWREIDLPTFSPNTW